MAHELQQSCDRIRVGESRAGLDRHQDDKPGALGLGAVIITGGRWPDGAGSTKKGNVLAWSSEDVADDTLVLRLIASGADLARCHFIEGIVQHGENVPFDPSKTYRSCTARSSA